jgi:galactonate dehydratase
MRIQRVECFQVPPRWTLVRVETDQGLAGWGESILARRPQAVRGAIADLADNLLGEDPRRIEDLWQRMFRGAFFRGGPVLMTAIAAIEQALWDLKGRMLGVPVHELLGGAVRDRVRLYAWVGGDRPGDVVAEARARAAQGFGAVKMNATAELHLLDDPSKLRAVRERVASVREEMGQDFGIAVDFHGRVHKAMARRLLALLEPYDLMWVEEPLLPEHGHSLAQLAAATSIPIATGERLASRWDYLALLEQRAVSIVQPDVSLTGLHELEKIGRMAEAYDLAVAPHCPNGPVSLAATLQVDACLPNVVIQEQSMGIHYNVGYQGLQASEPTDYLREGAPLTPQGGWLPVPSGPGLGIEIDEERVRRAAAGWRLPDPVWRNPDGTLAEW